MKIKFLSENIFCSFVQMLQYEIFVTICSKFDYLKIKDLFCAEITVFELALDFEIFMLFSTFV